MSVVQSTSREVIFRHALEHFRACQVSIVQAALVPQSLPYPQAAYAEGPLPLIPRPAVLSFDFRQRLGRKQVPGLRTSPAQADLR